jgi:hypothetical protein
MKGVMKMRKLMVLAIASLLFLGFSGQSMAGIHIGVNIPLPPVFALPAPPELVVIPGTYVYYDPDVDFNLFFYAGYWYRPYEGYWYRSVSYEGPWVYIGSPPPVLVNLPPDYWIVTRGYRRIPYGELHRNWRAWQRDRYWEHHNWGRMEHQREHGLAPSYGEHNNWGRMEHQREHGLAPSYRGGEYHEYGGGVHPEGGFHGGGGHEGHERR